MLDALHILVIADSENSIETKSIFRLNVRFSTPKLSITVKTIRSYKNLDLIAKTRMDTPVQSRKFSKAFLSNHPKKVYC